MQTLLKTSNSMPAQLRADVCQIVNQNLADIFDLASQCKQAHWNVKGPRFIMLHKFFDELYETVDGHVDILAERVTALGGVAMGTVRMATAASRLSDYTVGPADGAEHLAVLTARFATAAANARSAANSTQAMGDLDTSDMFIDLSRDLDKSLWFLDAHAQ